MRSLKCGITTDCRCPAVSVDSGRPDPCQGGGRGALNLFRIILDRTFSARILPVRMKPAPPNPSYDDTIAGRGFRMTGQRRAVYDALMAQVDHPTAVEVFMRVKRTMPTISLATVYNCLETLAECGLVRHVHHDRQSSRYCANLEEHAHLFCDQCGSVTDLPLRSKRRAEDIWELPADVVVVKREVSFRGFCPKCAHNGGPRPVSASAEKNPLPVSRVAGASRAKTPRSAV